MDRFTLNSEDAVLMVVDIQERLVPVMKYGKQVIENSNIIITIAKDFGIPIIVTEQYPNGLGPTVPELRSNLERSVTYEKISFTAFTDEVAAELEKLGRKKVIVEKRPILYA